MGVGCGGPVRPGGSATAGARSSRRARKPSRPRWPRTPVTRSRAARRKPGRRVMPRPMRGAPQAAMDSSHRTRCGRDLGGRSAIRTPPLGPCHHKRADSREARVWWTLRRNPKPSTPAPPRPIRVDALTSPCGIYPIPRAWGFLHDRHRARAGGAEFPHPARDQADAGDRDRRRRRQPRRQWIHHADLIREELPVARASSPEIVSVLIGANDIVQGSDEGSYRRRLQAIYTSVGELGLPAGRMLSISIPDFSGLPGAAPFGTAGQLRARVDAFNRIAQTEADSRGFQFADISGLSRERDRGDGWLAADGLHPGPWQHRAIADYLWEIVGGEWARITSP